MQITAELQGRVIPPAEFVRVIANPASGYIPKPSLLICDRTLEKFEDEKRNTEGGDFNIFVNLLKHLATCANGFDPEFFEGEGMTQKAMMAQSILYERYRREWRGDLDRTLEEYIVTGSLGLHELLCDEQMFVRAAMSYYVRRSMVDKHGGLVGFVKFFEPVAREVYLALTDTSNLDFEYLAEQMPHRFDRRF